MKQDFKDFVRPTVTRKSGNKKRISSASIILFVFILIIVTWISYALYHLHIGKKLLYAGDFTASFHHFITSSRTGVFPVQSKTGAGLSLLLAGNKEKAGMMLAGMIGEIPNHFSIEPIFRQLLQKGDYTDIISLGESLLPMSDDPALIYFTGLAYIAEEQLSNAADCMLMLMNSENYYLSAEQQLCVIENMIKDPEFSRLKDRYGSPLSHPLFSARDTVSANHHIRNLIDPLGFDPLENRGFVKLTVDSVIQDICENSLSSTKGIIAVMDPFSGQILGAAINGNHTALHFLFFKFEPGFFISIPLLLEYLSPGRASHTDQEIMKNLDSFFFVRESDTLIKIAESLGERNFAKALDNIGFNLTIDFEGINHPFGELIDDNDRDKPTAKFRYSGFEDIYTTPLHQLSIISLLINGGKLMKPGVILQKSDINNSSIYQITEQTLRNYKKPDAMMQIRDAMKNSVRKMFKRSGTPGNETDWAGIFSISGGIKTKNFSAVSGYAPVKKPKVAFFILLFDNAGGRNQIPVIVNRLLKSMKKSDRL